MTFSQLINFKQIIEKHTYYYIFFLIFSMHNFVFWNACECVWKIFLSFSFDSRQSKQNVEKFKFFEKLFFSWSIGRIKLDIKVLIINQIK